MKRFAKIVSWLTGVLLLKFEIEEDWSLEQYFKKSSDTYFKAFNHRFYPVEKILNDLDIPWHQLVASRFNIMHYDETNDAKQENIILGKQVDLWFDLSLQVRVYRNVLNGTFRFKDGVLHLDEMPEVAGAFIKILNNVAYSPQKTIKESVA